MITCKLTGNTGPPIKAHIVPKAFYELPPQEDGPYSLMSNVTGTFPKKLPTGIYDSTIVTKEGEKLFGPWDDYAVRILLNEANVFEEIRGSGKLIAWSLADYNYTALKLFALSVLWRANASPHPAFSKVQLGPHEGSIRSFLLKNQPGTSEQYSVIIVRWIDEEFGPVFMDPFRERYDGVNYYRIYCGRYVLYVKVDQKKTNDTFREMQLSPERNLFLIARELKKSKEWPIMQQIAQKNLR